MNEHLSERISRSRRGGKADCQQPTGQVEVLLLPPKLNPRIREYFEGPPVAGGAWLRRPEFPTSEEILDYDGSSSSSSSDNTDSASSVVEISANKPIGAFEDIEDYLSTQYELLREDAIKGLRDAVARVRITPQAAEDAFSGQVGIYEKIHICGVTLSTRGFAVRATFSLVRTGKQIIWEQSKRLITGSLVVLTPASDMFNSKAIVATIAARPLAGVQQNPPEIDLFFSRADQIEIDPAQEYVMVEDRSSFYEAARPTLLALQHMMKESFPLSEHLVDVKGQVDVPKFIRDNPQMDLTSALINNKHETYENVDVLRQWPLQPQSELDASQLKALHRILTKRLAIVQGPPGTGKTHVSVRAIEIMIRNRRPDDGPIIIACQTNHAIDQILRHIAQFEPEFVRLGGRSKDKEVIKKRTLYEVRNLTAESPPAGCMFGMARKKMADMEKEFALVLTPLMPNQKPLDHRTLENFKLLTTPQADSLESGASQWVQDKKSNPYEARSPFLIWLGDKLVPVPAKQEREEFGFDFEEVDLEFEQIKETEAENAKDDEEFEHLTGTYLPLADNFTCRPVPGSDTKIKDLLKDKDMWKIPEAKRPSIYRYLQAELKKQITTSVRDISKRYNEQVEKRRIGYWERDENVLKRQRVIGMTTTGFSKYRALISALQPKTILIEEAAETLESPVAVACIPSLQNLVLVGDHQQLRPHTQVRVHEGEPYYLNVSLFERLVNNNVEFDTLIKQRRMIPEIRRLLFPIYGAKITDHQSVISPAIRPPVPGMGGVNSFFFTHQWSEQRDQQMSSLNPMEAEMVVGLFTHLVYNGMDSEDITVLTFYNGQRKRILADLRRQLEGRKFNVVTVDSYQGEENKIVILSLVRSNENNQIGFLNVDNRVCVALSRAQCGFYIFGNGLLLHRNSATWKSVIEIMAAKKHDQTKAIRKDIPPTQPVRIGSSFPVRCSNHDRLVEIEEPDGWEKLLGGCDQPCGGTLPCGHPCELVCHPVSHEDVNCAKCRSKQRPQDNAIGVDPRPGENVLLEPRPSTGSKTSVSKSTDSWKAFTNDEPARVQKHIDSYQSNDATANMQRMNLGFDGAADVPSRSSFGGARVQYVDVFKIGGNEEEHGKQGEDWSKEDSLLD
ncbi:hypothetical protein M409DRAFT_68628 [Zasmidium cellare ATCC 36951]|uniref:Helicase ATP-binding domain-containing protein n=1 Tax=Zasmidium cellare ATCC 36951 TaxID=1080233 RepID=A0A6A6C8K6_ZASCE|nr:uncharacterized protein M409DRAFT_68628 [Zasmidium cellare ATCC 36951]KAF2163371.1 hypothetical protein M409DRAFT_68628 [Zasmidium cellare ATCC 36951]